MQRTQSSPTVYPFPASSSASRNPAPALAAFHQSGTTEPGLILVSPSGEVRFWEHLSLALSNVDRYQTIQLDLQGDSVERIWSVEVSCANSRH